MRSVSGYSGGSYSYPEGAHGPLGKIEGGKEGVSGIRLSSITEHLEKSKPADRMEPPVGRFHSIDPA